MNEREQQNDQKRRRDLADVGNEIIIIESDLARLLNKKEFNEVETRRLGKEMQQLEIRREELVETLKKLEKDEFFLRSELARLKKKRNTITG